MAKENEKRLIDANDFVKHFWQRVHDGEIVTLMDVEHAIINAPTVDAVEVVRCQKCTGYHSYGKDANGLVTWGKCKKIEMDVDMPANGFCCYGEKREGGGE